MRVKRSFWIWAMVIGGMLVVGKWGSVKAQVVTPKVFFSEYVEGTSNNKALELYNPTGESVDVGGWKVEKYTNGLTSVSGTVTIPAGVTIGPGGTYVMCNPNINSEALPKCNLTSGVLSFNGNDALVLKNGSGEVLDAIGQVGFDPVTSWGSGEVATVDRTLIRKCSVKYGDANMGDGFDPAGEWDGLPTNTFSELGRHTTCYTSTVTPTPAVEPTNIPTSTPEPTQIIEPTPTDTPLTPTPIEEITPTSEPSPTPTEEITPTPTMEVIPTEILTPTPTIEPTPTPKPENYKWKKWVCSQKTIKIKWGKSYKEVVIPVCFWEWHWWGFKFPLLHKHF